MPDPMQTDICQNPDPIVQAVFRAMNTPTRFYLETTCAEFVKMYRAAREAEAAEERAR
jgi:hypothetical protein